MVEDRAAAGASVGSGIDREILPAEAAAANTNLRDFVQMLNRRKFVAVGCAAVVMAIAACVLFALPPSYTAEAILMLDSQKARVIDAPAVMPELPSDQAIVRSEIEVLKSPALAEQVVDRLDLMRNAEFNAALAPSFWKLSGPAAAVVRALGDDLGIEIPAFAPAADGTSAAQRTRDDVALALADRLNVASDGRSYVLKIRFTASDPALAAAIANAYAEIYLGDQLEAKERATHRAANWLDAQLRELHEKASASDRSLALFRERNHLTEARGATVIAQQLAELNSQLITAVADRTQKEAALTRVEEAVRSGNRSALIEVTSSPLIQRLHEQEAELVRRQAELSNRFLSNYPAMSEVVAERNDLKRKIQDEGNKLVAAVTGDANAARQREDALRSRLRELEEKAAASDRAQAQLRALERDVEPDRTLYENFLARSKQAAFQSELQQSDARLVSRALVPRFPTFPNRRLFLVVSFAVASTLGILVALVLERLDDGFRSADQLESAAGVIALGLVPEIRRRSPRSLTAQHSISSYREAIRSFRTALKYAIPRDDPPRIIAITSSVAAEGKTTFACSLAESVARSGARVLIVDCDMRRPSVERILHGGRTAAPDLVSVLSEQAGLADVVRHHVSSGVDYVPSVQDAPNPQDLIESDRMRRFLEMAQREYDAIVLDAPPVLAVSDALLLSHLADATIFLVRWGHTPRNVALGGIRRLRSQGGKLAGIILSRVNLRMHASYRSGDGSYHFARYREHPKREVPALPARPSRKETAE